jgi:hypothetical protein
MFNRNQGKLANGIGVAADLSVILFALLGATVLVRNYLIRSPVPEAAAAAPKVVNSPSRPPADTLIQPGTKVSLPGMDWSKNGQTLLLAVSDKCHFCTESAPFYQHLAREHGKTRLVAVLPQPVADGRDYFAKMNVSIDEIRQDALGSLGVRGTPTLILVNGKGIAIKSWVGKLTADREAEVIAGLQ